MIADISMRMGHGVKQAIETVRRSATTGGGVYAVFVAVVLSAAVVLIDALLGGAARHSDHVSTLLRGDPAMVTPADRTEAAANSDGRPDQTGQRVLSMLETATAAPTAAQIRPFASLTGPMSVPKVSGGEDQRAHWYRGGGGTYTTVCVRLCDGWYRPVSFSTTPDNFERDSLACQSSCSTTARLYVFPNPGGAIEQMEDLSGQAYARLKTAFLFRSAHGQSCTCRPAPWEPRSAERHRVYALQASAVKGDKAAKRELAALGAVRIAALTEPAPGAVVESIASPAAFTSKSSAGRSTTRRSTKTTALASASQRPSAVRQTTDRSASWRTKAFESMR